MVWCRQRLVERNRKSSAYAGIIEQCNHPFHHSFQHHELLSRFWAQIVDCRSKLVSSRSAISHYSVLLERHALRPGERQRALEVVQSMQPGFHSRSCLTHTHDSTAVQAAYIASLESQVSSLRDEMAAVYKTQGQNAQRLLSMNETLREKEELSRIEAEALRKARDEIATLRRKVEQHDEIMLEKDRSVQVSLQMSVSAPGLP